MLSVRQSLLMGRGGVTDRDISEWMARGEALAAQGCSSTADGLPLHDRLCVKLCELDRSKGARLMLYAGEAAARILSSRDPRAMSAQTKLITHLMDHNAEPQAVVERGVGVSQEDMDAMTTAELAELERLIEARQEVSRQIDAVVQAARGRSTAAELH